MQRKLKQNVAKVNIDYRLQHCTVCVNYTMLGSKFNQTPMCLCGCVYVRIYATEFRVSKA